MRKLGTVLPLTYLLKKIGLGSLSQFIRLWISAIIGLLSITSLILLIPLARLIYCISCTPLFLVFTRFIVTLTMQSSDRKIYIHHFHLSKVIMLTYNPSQGSNYPLSFLSFSFQICNLEQVF